jgi:glutathione S-transferase
VKLHWSPRSPFVRKVMVTALELGLAERIERIRSVAITQTPNPALMADSPLNKIPALVLDDGEVLYDSAVICEYLNDLAGGDLYPKGGRERWTVLRRASLANGLTDLLIIWRGERSRAPEIQSKPHLAAYELKARRAMDVLEAEVDKLNTDKINIADIAVACVTSYLDFRFADLEWRKAWPKLDAWNRQIEARPSMKATVIVDDTEAAAASLQGAGA